MAYTAETAQVRAAQLKEGLAWSQNLMKEFNSALDSYSGNLTDLKMAVAGVAQRTQVRRAVSHITSCSQYRAHVPALGAQMEPGSWNESVSCLSCWHAVPAHGSGEHQAGQG